MSKKHLALAMVCVGMFSAFPNAAQAGLWDKRTVVTFSRAVEVPGAVLPAGTYVMKLVGAPSDRHVVQFTNERENQVFATAMAIPVERREYAEKTILTFYEMPKGQPEVLKTWFYPGENAGQEFTYPRAKALLISAASAQPVATSAVQAEPQTQTQVAPASSNDREINQAVAEALAPVPAPPAPEVAAAEATRQEEPVLVAQNTEPAAIVDNGNQQTEPATNELPKTAGEMPLIGLIGVLSLGAAAALKRRPAR